MIRKNNPLINISRGVLASSLFFSLVSCVQRPKALDLFKPDSTKKHVQLSAPTERTMTLLLGDNNKILYYLGDPQKPLGGPAVTGYGKDSLDKVLTAAMTRMKDTTDNYLIVLVKPSDESTYKNFVNTIVVINNCKVKSYAVVNIESNEIATLKKYGIYKIKK